MDNVPIVLAQYRLGKTLGIGAFGKVKRKCWEELSFLLAMVAKSIFELIISRSSHCDGIESGSEDTQQGEN